MIALLAWSTVAQQASLLVLTLPRRAEGRPYRVVLQGSGAIPEPSLHREANRSSCHLAPCERMEDVHYGRINVHPQHNSRW